MKKEYENRMRVYAELEKNMRGRENKKISASPKKNAGGRK